MVLKIAVIGPESTGKSTLCSLLSRHFTAYWCPEFAREYLLTHGKHYTYEDLLVIAKGQLAMEDEYTQKVMEERQQPGNPISSPLLFLDTDMYVMKVWSEYVFGKCHQFILDEIANRKYDLYLLCNTDMPWVQDELREYPDEAQRKELYQIYKDILVNQQTPWVEIRGDYDQRLALAVKAVERL